MTAQPIRSAGHRKDHPHAQKRYRLPQTQLLPTPDWQPLALELPTLAAIAFTLVAWASAFAGIRVALHAYTPVQVALLRYIVASLVLLLYAGLTRTPLPRWRDLPGIILLGFIGITCYNLALSLGQVTIPAGSASLLIASAPIWMALLAWGFLGERLRGWGWIGIVVSFGGVALIALGTRRGIALDPRALLILAAALAQSIYSLGQKRYLARYSALQWTSYVIWAGTLCLLPYSAGLITAIQAAPTATTLAVVYLGIFPGALGYMTWAYALARTPATTAGSFLYIVPALAMLIAWLWLGEIPSLLSVSGGLLVIAGVILVNTWGRQRDHTKTA